MSSTTTIEDTKQNDFRLETPPGTPEESLFPDDEWYPPVCHHLHLISPEESARLCAELYTALQRMDRQRKQLQAEVKQMKEQLQRAEEDTRKARDAIFMYIQYSKENERIQRGLGRVEGSLEHM